MSGTTSAAAFLILATFAHGQAMQFEAASIEPAQPGATGRSPSHNPGARLTTSNATVKMLILLAYQVMPAEISGGPGWLDAEGFDIEARGADPQATEEQFREMIRGLLSDRFRLTVHRETKELPVYSLVVARNGAKLGEANPDDPEVSLRIEGPGQPDQNPSGPDGASSGNDGPSIFTELQGQLGLTLKAGRDLLGF